MYNEYTMYAMLRRYALAYPPSVIFWCMFRVRFMVFSMFGRRTHTHDASADTVRAVKLIFEENIIINIFHKTFFLN